MSKDIKFEGPRGEIVMACWGELTELRSLTSNAIYCYNMLL